MTVNKKNIPNFSLKSFNLNIEDRDYTGPDIKKNSKDENYRNGIIKQRENRYVKIGIYNMSGTLLGEFNNTREAAIFLLEDGIELEEKSKLKDLEDNKSKIKYVISRIVSSLTYDTGETPIFDYRVRGTKNINNSLPKELDLYLSVDKRWYIDKHNVIGIAEYDINGVLIAKYLDKGKFIKKFAYYSKAKIKQSIEENKFYKDKFYRFIYKDDNIPDIDDNIPTSSLNTKVRKVNKYKEAKLYNSDGKCIFSASVPSSKDIIYEIIIFICKNNNINKARYDSIRAIIFTHVNKYKGDEAYDRTIYGYRLLVSLDSDRKLPDIIKPVLPIEKRWSRRHPNTCGIAEYDTDGILIAKYLDKDEYNKKFSQSERVGIMYNRSGKRKLPYKGKHYRYIYFNKPVPKKIDVDKDYQ